MRNSRSVKKAFLILILIEFSVPLIQSNLYIQASDFSKIKMQAENPDSWSTILVKEEEIDDPIMHGLNNSIYIVGRIDWYNTYVAKFNSSGIKLWEHIWEGPEREFVNSFIIDSENNLYIAGITDSSYPSGGDIYLLKYNNSGALLWSKIFNPYPSYECSFISLQLDNNNSLYISGYISGNVFLLKLDLLGEILWNRQFNVNLKPIQIETQIDSENHIYVYYRDEELNPLLIKYNYLGSVQWNKTWQEEIIGLGFKLNLNGNILIVSLIKHGNSTFDIWIMSINKSGENVNMTKLNYSGSISDYIFWDYEYYQCYFDDYNNIYIHIKCYSTDPVVFKFNSSLEYQWSCPIDIIYIENNYELRVDKDLNLYYVSSPGLITGYGQNTQISIVRINSSGDITLHTDWGGPNADFFEEMAIDYQNNLYMICTSVYDIRWGFYSPQTVLVKNPKPNGNPPTLKIKFNFIDYSLFSFMGIMSVVSIGIVWSILKRKFNNRLNMG